MAEDIGVKVILVDPFTHTVSLASVQGSNESVFNFSRKFMGVRMLDIVRAGKYFGGDAETIIIIDDEGLLTDQGAQAFTLVGNKTLAGRLVIICEGEYNEDGDTDVVDVASSVEDVVSKIKFISKRFAEAARILDMLNTAAYHVARGHKVDQVSPGVLFITED